MCIRSKIPVKFSARSTWARKFADTRLLMECFTSFAAAKTKMCPENRKSGTSPASIRLRLTQTRKTSPRFRSHHARSHLMANIFGRTIAQRMRQFRFRSRRNEKPTAAPKNQSNDNIKAVFARLRTRVGKEIRKVRFLLLVRPDLLGT